jgi:hypothetical protein
VSRVLAALSVVRGATTAQVEDPVARRLFPPQSVHVCYRDSCRYSPLQMGVGSLHATGCRPCDIRAPHAVAERPAEEAA